MAKLRLPYMTGSRIFCNEDALALLDMNIKNRVLDLYAIKDKDLFEKERRGKVPFINIRVRVDHLPSDQPVHEKYGATLLFREDIGIELFQHNLVSIIQEIAQTMSAQAGLIELSDSGNRSITFTEQMRITNRKDFAEQHDLSEIIPGVFWWTLLSKKHIEKLGGKEQISQNAPCYAVHDLSDGEYHAVALQLSSSPFEIGDEAYDKLIQYLQPVLPPVNIYSLAFELKRRELPINRIRMFVDEDTIQKASKFVDWSYAELREKAQSTTF